MRSSTSADRRRRRGPLLTALAALTLLTACTASVDGDGGGSRSSSAAPTTTAPNASPSASTAPTAAAQPANSCGTYAAPDPDRPVLDLSFTLAADHSHVDGVETVTFTPDAAVDELVFRLTPNTAPSVEQGNRIEVTAATADHGGGTATYTAAGAAAGTQGGLLRIPFGASVPAGTRVTARVAFTTTLGEGSFDRFGRTAGYAWWASGHPLLAWERGYGWHTEPLLQFTAESATSEAMATTLRVTAPEADVVVMSGNPTAPTSTSAGTRTWTATLDSARDVSVAAGPFQVTDSTVDAGRPVALRVGAPTAGAATALQTGFQRALTELAARFGPYGFPSLAVARLPIGGGGIEYPGSILMFDDSRLVTVHETAHMWFYAMVGDSQAQHAWLDEAFATYAEELVDGTPAGSGFLTQDPAPVDRTMADWGDDEGGYYRTTYDKGAAALFAARAAAGADAFDAAIRCYVARNAWTVADPSDVQAALTDLPAAVEVLRQAGALR